MKRLLVLASAATALIVLVGAPAASAATTTLHVNAATGVDSATCGSQASPCRTIGQAVANAAGGASIVVAPGTYDESVSIHKSLTLDGAQAGNPGTAARAPEAPATESVLTGGNIDVEASAVTIDGFSFGYAGNQVCVACQPGTTNGLNIHLSGVKIENNVFSGYQPVNFGPWQVTAAIGVNHTTGVQIVGNYFTSPTGNFSSGGAVVQFFDGGCSGANVSSNTFDAADSADLADIYFYCDSEVGEATTNITVSGNHDNITGSSDFALFTHVGGGAEVDVTRNTVTMTPSGSSGIYFSTDGNSGGIGTLDISGNTLTGSPFRAVKLNTNAQIPGQVTITGNNFSGNGVGVYVGASSLAGGSVVLRGNDFSGETGDTAGDPADGVYDGGSGGTIDAADNWWGCNGGPGASGCSLVTASVTSANPWLVLGLSASPASLVAGASTIVTADLTHDSNGADTSAAGTMPDGGSVAFSTDAGALSASSAGTSGGKASVTLRSTSVGTAHVTATFEGQSVPATVTFTVGPPAAAQSTLRPAGSTILANGSSTQVLTVQAVNAEGGNVTAGGATVTITKLSGAGSIGAVTDNGDGTYTATVTAPSSPGTGVFVATLNGSPVKGGGATQTQVTVHFLGQPTITSFTPGSGGDHATVTVTGTNFTGVTHVRLNGSSVPFTVVSDTTLKFTVPEGATGGTIVVANPLATSAPSSGSFTIVQPTISSVSPGSGAVGDTVTITGTDLTGAVGVELGKILVVPTSVTDTQVTFRVPAGAVTGLVKVITPSGAATSPGTFTVT